MQEDDGHPADRGFREFRSPRHQGRAHYPGRRRANQKADLPDDDRPRPRGGHQGLVRRVSKLPKRSFDRKDGDLRRQFRQQKDGTGNFRSIGARDRQRSWRDRLSHHGAKRAPRRRRVLDQFPVGWAKATERKRSGRAHHSNKKGGHAAAAALRPLSPPYIASTLSAGTAG